MQTLKSFTSISRPPAVTARGPMALLLNGGVFHAERLAERLVATVAGWSAAPVERLPATEPELAVAVPAEQLGLF